MAAAKKEYKIWLHSLTLTYNCCITSAPNRPMCKRSRALQNQQSTSNTASRMPNRQQRTTEQVLSDSTKQLLTVWIKLTLNVQPKTLNLQLRGLCGHRCSCSAICSNINSIRTRYRATKRYPLSTVVRLGGNI